jgi:F0F1-type ATP synthase membrane subunit b/b'
MSLEKIVDKILDDARAEADLARAESLRKAADIREEAKRQAGELAGALLREAEREARLEAGRIVTQARLEGRIELLTARKSLITEVLEGALAAASIRGRSLVRRVILKDGEREEPFDRAKLLDEVRPGLESLIADILKI